MDLNIKYSWNETNFRVIALIISLREFLVGIYLMAVVIKRNNNLSANLNMKIRWKLNYFVENIEEVKINSTSNESNGKFVAFCTLFSLMLKIKNLQSWMDQVVHPKLKFVLPIDMFFCLFSSFFSFSMGQGGQKLPCNILSRRFHLLQGPWKVLAFWSRGGSPNITSNSRMTPQHSFSILGVTSRP